MDTEICEAIQWRNIITFEYNNFQRTVEPYMYGIGPTGEALWGFQIDGDRESFESEWILFDGLKIKELTITDQHFEFNQLDYNPNHSPISIIYCSV